MEPLKYKPSDISKINENIIKQPLIDEHNEKSILFNDGKISKTEWEAFKKDWENRFAVAMNDALKDRIYVEDMTNEVI